MTNQIDNIKLARQCLDYQNIGCGKGFEFYGNDVNCGEEFEYKGECKVILCPECKVLARSVMTHPPSENSPQTNQTVQQGRCDELATDSSSADDSGEVKTGDANNSIGKELNKDYAKVVGGEK
jgi:hypothetical protein